MKLLKHRIKEGIGIRDKESIIVLHVSALPQEIEALETLLKCATKGDEDLAICSWDYAVSVAREGYRDSGYPKGKVLTDGIKLVPGDSSHWKTQVDGSPMPVGNDVTVA